MKFSNESCIDTIELKNTGGNYMVDYIHLKNGFVVGLSDESLVVYANKKDIDEQVYVHDYAFPVNSGIRSVINLISMLNNEEDTTEITFLLGHFSMALATLASENPKTYDNYKPTISEAIIEFTRALNGHYPPAKKKAVIEELKDLIYNLFA